ncbi:hypothetical protein ACM66B_003271 [Microbotryomycetes sp. NB124-2]
MVVLTRRTPAGDRLPENSPPSTPTPSCESCQLSNVSGSNTNASVEEDLIDYIEYNKDDLLDENNSNVLGGQSKTNPEDVVMAEATAKLDETKITENTHSQANKDNNTNNSVEKTKYRTTPHPKKLSLSALELLPVITALTSVIKSGFNESQAQGSNRNKPKVFNGQDRALCTNFLFKCDMEFKDRPKKYASSEAKLCYIGSFLAGQPQEWFRKQWVHGNLKSMPYQDFANLFASIYGHSRETEVQDDLVKFKNLHQATLSISEFIGRFNLYSHSVGQNNTSLQVEFMTRLNQSTRDKLIPFLGQAVEKMTLQEIQDGARAYKSQQRLYRTDERESSAKPHRTERSNHCVKFTKPNRVVLKLQDRFSHKPAKPALKSESQPKGFYDPTRDPRKKRDGTLTEAEKDHRRKNNLCLYCGGSNHKVIDCPNKAKQDQDRGQRSHASSVTIKPTFTTKAQESDSGKE